VCARACVLGTQGLVLGRYSTTWAILLAPFCFVTFQLGSQVFAQAGLGMPSSYMGLQAHTPSLPYVMKGILLTFCLCWPQNAILLISVSQVQQGITTPALPLGFKYLFSLIFWLPYGISTQSIYTLSFKCYDDLMMKVMVVLWHALLILLFLLGSVILKSKSYPFWIFAWLQ
jgi:hypothetical protein